MGFSVTIEADWGSEVLQNQHPDGKPSGGKAVFAFWGGLEHYCRDGSMVEIADWYGRLNHLASEPLCSVCLAFIDCAWGDGGDGTHYGEDEFEFYKKRHGAAITEEQFQSNLQHERDSWQPIGDVIRGVQLLLDLFKSHPLKECEGFYKAEDSIPDFEALLWNLELLAKRRNEVVRLNFS